MLSAVQPAISLASLTVAFSAVSSIAFSAVSSATLSPDFRAGFSTGFPASFSAGFSARSFAVLSTAASRTTSTVFRLGSSAAPTACSLTCKGFSGCSSRLSSPFPTPPSTTLKVGSL
uniref:Uncharacterized protein n=1 Tax=Ixodes ricinus TaxID=34613 RepID=A0A6B0ULT4_IXORI